MIVELMLLKRDLEIVTQRLYPPVTLTYPFGPELADQVRILRKSIREDPPSDSVACFKDRHVPSGVL
jgi:hypothetical protein